MPPARPMRHCRRATSKRTPIPKRARPTPERPTPEKPAGSSCNCRVIRTSIAWLACWSAPGGGGSRPQTGCSAMSRERSERTPGHHLRTPPTISKIDTVASSILIVESAGEGFVDITGEAKAFVADTRAASGLVTLFLRHTSASLTIQENADPDVLRDLVT